MKLTKKQVETLSPIMQDMVTVGNDFHSIRFNGNEELKKSYWGLEQDEEENYNLFVWGDLDDEDSQNLNRFLIAGSGLLGIPLRPELF